MPFAVDGFERPAPTRVVRNIAGKENKEQLRRSKKNVRALVLNLCKSDDMANSLRKFSVARVRSSFSGDVGVKFVQKRSAACLKQAALGKVPLRRTASRDELLWCYSEDAPESSIKLEGFLSPVEIVAEYAPCATGSIHRIHFVVRRGSDSVDSSFEL